MPPFYSFSLIEKICKKKLEEMPDNKNVLWFLGNFYIWNNKYDKAQEHLESLLRIEKDSKGVKLALSRVYFRLGKYSKVIDILKEPGVLSENDVENYYLGESLIEIQDYENAIDVLEKYVKHHSTQWIPFVRLGNSYFIKGFYDRALKSYRSAEQLNPTDTNIKENILACVKKLREKIEII